MEAFVALLLVGLCVGLVCIFAAAHHAAARSERRRLLAEVAKTHGGEVLPGAWFEPTQLRLRRGGAVLRLSHYSTGGKHPRRYMQLEGDWPDVAARMKLYPEHAFVKLGKFLGVRDLEVGDRWFDETFALYGRDAESVRLLLNPCVRTILRRLHGLAQGGDVQWSIEGGVWRLRCHGWIAGAAELTAWLGEALELYDAAGDGGAGGVEFLESTELFGETKLRHVCPVCGDAIEPQRLVVCPRCRAPHHAECWDYNGKCATFGCFETRASRRVRPR